MSRYEHGRILAVNESTLGSELVADHAAGVTTLTVVDPVDFDEDGGRLVINDEVIAYATFDDDTGEITLEASLSTAAVEGDRVLVYDPLYQAPAAEKVAECILDGDDDNDDPLEAAVADHLTARLAEGIRGVTGESVLLELDGDEWRVVDVLGLAAQGGAGASGRRFFQDSHAVEQAGDQTVRLTYEPVPNSEHVYWNGLYQPGSEWSRVGKALVMPDPDALLIAGDQLVVEYAYDAARDAIDDQQPAADTPWWEGDPAQGCSKGYPTSATVSLVTLTQEPPAHIHTIFADVNVQMQSTAEWDAYVVWTYDGPTIYDDPAHPGDARYQVTWAFADDPDAQGYRVSLDRNLVRLYPGALQDEATIVDLTDQSLADVTVVGVVVVPHNATPSYLGDTNGSQCRFYLGTQIASTPDPADTGGVAEPYLPITVLR